MKCPKCKKEMIFLTTDFDESEVEWCPNCGTVSYKIIGKEDEKIRSPKGIFRRFFDWWLDMQEAAYKNYPLYPIP